MGLKLSSTPPTSPKQARPVHSAAGFFIFNPTGARLWSDGAQTPEFFSRRALEIGDNFAEKRFKHHETTGCLAGLVFKLNGFTEALSREIGSGHNLAKFMATNRTMYATVNIGELKNPLSEFLERLENGEEILVCKRNVPFATISGLPQRENHSQPGWASGSLRILQPIEGPAIPDDDWSMLKDHAEGQL